MSQRHFCCRLFTVSIINYAEKLQEPTTKQDRRRTKKKKQNNHTRTVQNEDWHCFCCRCVLFFYLPHFSQWTDKFWMINSGSFRFFAVLLFTLMLCRHRNHIDVGNGDNKQKINDSLWPNHAWICAQFNFQCNCGRFNSDILHFTHFCVFFFTVDFICFYVVNALRLLLVTQFCLQKIIDRFFDW